VALPAGGAPFTGLDLIALRNDSAWMWVGGLRTAGGAKENPPARSIKMAVQAGWSRGTPRVGGRSSHVSGAAACLSRSASLAAWSRAWAISAFTCAGWHGKAGPARRDRRAESEERPGCRPHFESRWARD